MSKSFFTILQDYLRCCTCRCCLHTNASGDDGNDGGSGSSSGSSGSGINGIVRDYSFDDVSSTTPISWSSSSSLEDYKVAYKRPCFKQHTGIIPTNYYSD